MKDFVFRFAKLETHEATAGFEHSIGLADHLLDIRAITNTKSDRVHVVRVIGLVDKLLGVAHTPLSVRPEADSFGSLFANVEHVRVDVCDGHFDVAYRRVFVFQITEILKCDIAFLNKKIIYRFR